jgi:fatty acid desaturase
MNFKETLIKASTDIMLLCTIAVAAGLIYYQADMLGWALLFGLFVFNCGSLIVHEGWGHKYILPKNKLIKFIADMFGYLSFFPTPKSISPRLYWNYVHITHHIKWKDSDDYLQWGLDHNNSWIYLFTSRFRKTKRIVTDDIFKRETDKYLKNLNQFERFVDKHYNAVTIGLHILLLAVLGIKLYFYFVFFQIWLFTRSMVLFGEIMQHKGKKTKEDEKDNSLLLFPFFTSNTFHISHHVYPNEMNLGAGLLKYFNMQYYFIKLFYNVSPHVSIKK